MAEKFMTRRERREAERRQADAAYDAQQAAETEAEEASAAAEAAEAPEAPAGAEPHVPEAVTAEPEAVTSAPEAPVAPPRPTVEPDLAAASQPEPQAAASDAVPEAAPDAESDLPPRPATDPAPAPAAAPLTEPPSFSSRGERKRFLRDHDLPPDIPTASIPIVLAQRASGTAQTEWAETPDAAEAAAPAQAAERPHDEPTAVAEPTVEDEPTAAPELDAEPGPADEQSAADAPAPEAAPALIDTPAPAPAVAPDLSTDTDDATASPSPTASLFPTASPAVGSGPQFDLASRRVDSHTTGPDFETSSTAVITPSALGDFDQPIKRRSPVVKPPTGSNIRVVTGALPIVTQQDLDANPPTTPMSAIDADALAADDRGTGTFRTSESPVFRASRPVSDPWAQLGDSAAEEEEDSDELEEPPARPMSARSVTNEDGTVLVAERNSMVPFIVLGATGFAALVLVIVAITLLF